nr:chymotrypsin-like elastase family member 2A [Maniola hyperantus]
MKKVILTLLFLCYIEVKCVKESKIIVPTYNTEPCDDSDDIKVSYDSDVALEEGNQYLLTVNKTVTKNMKMILTFDSDCIVTLKDKSFARIFPRKKNTFDVRVFKLNNGIEFIVKGQDPKTVPQIKSLVMNTKEFCKQPKPRYLDGTSWENKDYSESVIKESRTTCGRRKVPKTKFSYNAASTKPGDFPWHTAVYKHDNTEIKYICGGTLISNKFVLTAAQCTSLEGTTLVPETLSVFLGKFNLIGGDEGSQQRVVKQIIMHENFRYQNLDNDISLLKLKTDVVFSDFVQPACLWHNKALNILSRGEVFGTVVGWGFDTTDSWSPHLQQIQIPMVPEGKCLQSNPLVYSTYLNNNKFCAGYGVRDEKTRGFPGRETPNCNGDSGSAFQIFIPDNARDKATDAAGAWYVRGIVSLSVSRPDSPSCDPQQYVVFTDVAKYGDWIDLHLKY